ncbi:MAG: ABC-2 family transporter protein [Microgenomates group bacterium]|nr:ABC-2 family transporter protein [Microgenomates group bacterium]
MFFIIGKLIRFVFFVFFIYILFSQTKLIRNYNFNQIIIFYLTFNLIDTLSQALFREVYRFRPLILSGNFDLVLTKPHHPFLKILLGGVDFLDVFLFIPYIGLIIYFGLKIPNIHLISVFLYILFIFNSLLITTAFHIAVLAFGILTTSVDHIIFIYRDLMSVGRFPIDIYKSPVREIFIFFIPTAVVMTFPAKILLGILTWPFFLWSFFVSLLSLFLALRLWDFALRKYQSYGG